MNFKILLGILIFGFLATPVLAQENTTTRDYCISNNTLAQVFNETRCVGNQCKEFSKINYKICATGCDSVNNDCNPNPTNQIFYFFGIVLAILFIIFLIIKFGRG